MRTAQGYPAVAVLKILHKSTLSVTEYDYQTYAEAVTAYDTMKATHPEEIYFLHINIVEIQ